MGSDDVAGSHFIQQKIQIMVEMYWSSNFNSEPEFMVR